MSNDLNILTTARDEAAKRVEQDPTAENLTALEKVSKMLADLQRPEPEPSLKNRLAVLKYLDRKGFKIGKTKLYDASKKGLLRFQQDGSVSIKDVDRYIKISGLLKPEEIEATKETKHLQMRKLKAETTKTERQSAALKHKQEIDEGLYISRFESELEFTSKAQVLKSGLEYNIYSNAHDIIELVKNTPPEFVKQRLIDKQLQDLHRQFNYFANIKEFIVNFFKNKTTHTST